MVAANGARFHVATAGDAVSPPLADCAANPGTGLAAFDDPGAAAAPSVLADALAAAAPPSAGVLEVDRSRLAGAKAGAAPLDPMLKVDPTVPTDPTIARPKPAARSGMKARRVQPARRSAAEG